MKKKVVEIIKLVDFFTEIAIDDYILDNYNQSDLSDAMKKYNRLYFLLETLRKGKL